MKTIKNAIIWAVALSFASVINSYAIENLQVGIQSSNVVLSWPSTNIETYIVQYRSNLDMSPSWLTLTDFFPATSTNLTLFIHSNAVNYGYALTNGGGDGGEGGGGGGILPPGATNGGGGFVAGTGFYRVVRDGVHIYGMTNGMVLNGEIKLPIEFAVGSTDQIVGVTFNDQNDEPIIGATSYGTNNTWTLDWNTLVAFNGDYQLYAQLHFANDDSVVSEPVDVTVDNIISFPNYYSRIFGSQMWIFAQTIPDAYYTIDMYDVNSNYLGTFADYSDDNGYISFTWDLTDGNGHTFDSTNFFGVFTVDTSSEDMASKATTSKASFNSTSANFQSIPSPSKKMLNSGKLKVKGVHPNDGGGSSASALQNWAKEFDWISNNNWVIAYASLNGDSTTDDRAKDMILGGVNEDTDWGGVIGTLDEYGFKGNLSPGNNGQAGQVFTLQDAETRTNLLSYLADMRYENFYYFGHGNDTAISAYKGSHTLITDSDIENALGNPAPFIWGPYPSQANYHPYRFVFIDACETGKGSFSESFAIPAVTISTNDFASYGLESRVFVGFTKSIDFDNSLSSDDSTGVPNRSIMMAYVFGSWENRSTDVNHIIGNAVNLNYGYAEGYKMDSSVVIYGAYDLIAGTRTRP